MECAAGREERWCEGGNTVPARQRAPHKVPRPLPTLQRLDHARLPLQHHLLAQALQGCPRGGWQLRTESW